MLVGRSTPLLQLHRKWSANWTKVGDVSVPLFFKSIEADYVYARERCGLADLGYHNLLRLTGKRALEFLDGFCTHDIASLRHGTLQRVVLTADSGHIVDIPLLLVLENFLLLMVTPGCVDAILDLLADDVPDGVEIEPFDDTYAIIGLIGPQCDAVLRNAMREDFREVPPQGVSVANIYTARVIQANTRLYGEPIQLLFTGVAYVDTVVSRLMESGDTIIKPVGVATLDILRLEAGEPLPGLDTALGVLPQEIGLMSKVDFGKPRFSGREQIFQSAQVGKGDWLVGFVMKDSLIPRRQSQIFSAGGAVGQVTSGSYSFALKRGVGLGIIDRTYGIKGEEIRISCRGRQYIAEIVSRPLYINPRSEALHRL